MISPDSCPREAAIKSTVDGFPAGSPASTNATRSLCAVPSSASNPAEGSKLAVIIHIHSYVADDTSKHVTSKSPMLPFAVATCECYKAQDLSKIRCDKQVERDFPGCEHAIKAPCCVDVTARDFHYSATCGEVLRC